MSISPVVAAVQVNRKAEGRLADGHLWIFASDVLEHGSAQPGSVVPVTGSRGQFLGQAHYSSSSQITLRMLSSREQPLDSAFWRGRLEKALALRRQVVRDATAYRLVHGEGDLLPGLVVDRYGNSLSVQTLSQGMDRQWLEIQPLLQELVQPQRIILRNDAPVRKQEELPLEKRVAYGDESMPVTFTLNGLTLYADLLGGQKTGVFLDQRENYAAARLHAHGRALDCFTCTGGFALHMASACDQVEAVDSSAQALVMVRHNAQANGIENVATKQADVFELLPALVSARREYQTIVLDPPAFTKTRAAREGALRGYREINQRALRLLSQGGILITCSCSHHVSEADLLEVVAQASLDARKRLRVRERRTQAQDHPILLTVPETHYLKCLVMEVV